ncbi:acetyl-CoA synthetase-like protein [Hypoxylon trugodes]|uniref:acetyl-CoA synthetase-like protein n=1 Tax=Hypoxylon trugodes TaxID=326681 RepID=UPI00218E6D1A|nr:acetyl-CoA synthetase-like protein [Hypoxylon trugodes]KAI1391508.1 acetyl-CoA synthetase-like protein [Hypoxylon trugodes]
MAGFHELIPIVVKRRINEKRPVLRIAHPERDPIDVTFATLDNAVNRVAWFLTENLASDEETFIWMSQSDARYIIFAIAAMKTSKVVVFPSMSNRVSANLRLFDSVGSKHLFYGPESEGTLAELIGETSSAVAARPGLSLEDILSAEPVPDYPFDKTYDEVKDKRYMGLHTSGTSGHPKPIWWTHAHLENLYSPLEEGVLPKGIHTERPTCSTLANHDVLVIGAQSHAGAMYITMVSLHSPMTAILLHPDAPPIPANITAVINKTGANSMISPAVPIENMLDYPPGVEVLQRLKHIGYVGGPMNPILGSRVAAITPHLYGLIGSTEAALYHLDYSSDSSNWDALRFVDVGQRMDEVFPGLFELVFPRTPEIERLYAFWRSYPDLVGDYHTKDLFAPVPGQPGWWRFRGRTDNWVAMANGYKMDPSDFEAVVTSHPDVRGVIVGGSHRFRLCMLVELHEHLIPATPEDAHAALDKLWPKIQEANQTSPKFGQIPRELVLFTPPGKPFLRTGKGSIQRQLTLQAYEEEIDALYERVESGILVNDLDPITSLVADGLTPVLTQLFQQALDAPEVGPDTDVFARGLDSNGVTITVSRLKAALRDFGVEENVLQGIGISLLYCATTARTLSAAISAYLLNGGNGGEADDGGVADMLEKYIPLVQQQPSATQDEIEDSETPELETEPQPQSIILTGTTGSLGTYILAALQALPAYHIGRIFCLNRAPDAAIKQISAFQSRSLPPIDEDRVTFLTVPDFSAPKLGLDKQTYTNLLTETSAIIHNAWPVNFLLPLKSFEPSIAGLVNLLQLSRDGKREPALFFVSSISAAMGAARDVPEDVLPSPESLVLRQGYARSKYVGERLLDAYVRATARRAAVLRVGQVAGPVALGGVWNTWEWFPSLVRSAKFLGVLPQTLGTSSRVEWVPVDELSRIVLEVVDDVVNDPDVAADNGESAENGENGYGDGNGKVKGAKVYNLVNPTPVDFSDLLPALREKGIATNVTMFEDWIDLLETSSRTARKTSVDENPAVKLLDFYRSLVPKSGSVDSDEEDSVDEDEDEDDDEDGVVVNGESRQGKASSRVGEDDYTWRVDNILNASPSARALKPVNTEWVKLWVDRWGL